MTLTKIRAENTEVRIHNFVISGLKIVMAERQVESNIRKITQAICILHCKNIWVTSTIFWSPQLHTCCVTENIICTSGKDAYNLTPSVVDKLLPFVILGSSCRRPIN